MFFYASYNSQVIGYHKILIENKKDENNVRPKINIGRMTL